MTERVSSVAVKARPFGRCAALTESAPYQSEEHLAAKEKTSCLRACAWARMRVWKKFGWIGESVFVHCAQVIDSSGGNARIYDGSTSGSTVFTYVLGNPISYADPSGLQTARPCPPGWICFPPVIPPGPIVPYEPPLFPTAPGWIENLTAAVNSAKKRASRLAANIIAKAQGRNCPNDDDDECDKQEKKDEQECNKVPWENGLRSKCYAAAAVKAAKCRADNK